MAILSCWVGSVGPYLYDDSKYYADEPTLPFMAFRGGKVQFDEYDQSHTATVVDIKDNEAEAYKFAEDSNDYLVLDTTDSDEKVIIHKPLLVHDQIVSDLAIGTAPLDITSTTLVDNLNVDSVDGADLIDEDDMASDSDIHFPTQQSTKAYVDSSVAGVLPADPDDDRLLGWDDSDTGNETKWFTVGTGLAITGIDLATDDSAIVHDNLSGFEANEHMNTLAWASDLKPDADNTRDLGGLGPPDYRWKDLKLSGNLDDGTNQLTVANAKSAFDHVSADGSSHGFIDQDVQTTASPTFVDLTLNTPSNIYNLSHDSFADFVADEHIDWTNASDNLLTSGSITGGGIITPLSSTPLAYIQGLDASGDKLLLFAQNYIVLRDASDEYFVVDIGNNRMYGASGIDLLLQSAQLQFNDTNTEVWEDADDNLSFKDANAGTRTLLETFIHPDINAYAGVQGLYFNGSNTHYATVTDAASIRVGDDDFSVIVQHRPNTTQNSDADLIGTESGVASAQGWRFYAASGTSNAIRFRVHDGASIYGGAAVSTTDHNDKNVCYGAVFTHGSTIDLYVNGENVQSTDISGCGDVNASKNLGIGYTDATARTYTGTMYRALIFNLALSAAEMREFSAGAPVPYKYVGASNAELSSGSLTLGKMYRITAHDGEDFTADGAADNNVGTEFLATGTSVTLDANDKAVRIGCTSQFEPQGLGDGTGELWEDWAGNADASINAGFRTPNVNYADFTAQDIICDSVDGVDLSAWLDQSVKTTAKPTFGSTVATNFMMGTNAGDNDEGASNFFAGTSAGRYNDTTGAGDEGEENVYIGYFAGRGDASGNTGYKNVAIGKNTLLSNTSGYLLVAIGGAALTLNTSGYKVVAIGSLSCSTNTSGHDIVAVGNESCKSTTSGAFLLAFGSGALYSNTDGEYNMGFGGSSLKYNQSGDYNIGIGDSSVGGDGAARSFNKDIGIGYKTLYVVTGDGNLSAGHESCLALTSGAGNTVYGTEAAQTMTTTNYSVIIGYQTGKTQTIGSNELWIDNQDRATPLIFGEFDNLIVQIHDTLKILERSSDPSAPGEGENIIWLSDGTGKGDDGDLMVAGTAGGTTNYGILWDHSAGTSW